MTITDSTNLRTADDDRRPAPARQPDRRRVRRASATSSPASTTSPRRPGSPTSASRSRTSGAVLAWQAGDGPPAGTPRPRAAARHGHGRLDRRRRVASTAGRLLSTVVLDGSRGQLPILDRGVRRHRARSSRTDERLGRRPRRPRTARSTRSMLVPLSAGYYELSRGGRAAASLRVLAFRQDYPADHPWAHPVDGLSRLRRRRRRDGHPADRRDEPCRSRREPGNFDDPAVQGAPLDPLKPIVITQPEGPSFTVDGERVEWGNWDSRSASTPARASSCASSRSTTPARSARSSTGRRSARWSCPTATRRPARFWQNYFDTGEYLFGRFTNSLELGCDCVGEINYFDAVLADELGNPRTIENAICMHEEDFGTLWKHTDLFTGSNEVRRQRRLVISLLHHRRQLRLRLLLVPLPRRHDRVRGQAHRHPVHLGVPGRRGRRRYAVRSRSRPGSARRTTSTCSRPVST